MSTDVLSMAKRLERALDAYEYAEVTGDPDAYRVAADAFEEADEPVEATLADLQAYEASSVGIARIACKHGYDLCPRCGGVPSSGQVLDEQVAQALGPP